MVTVVCLIGEDSWKATDNTPRLRESKALKWRTYHYIPLSDKTRVRREGEMMRMNTQTNISVVVNRCPAPSSTGHSRADHQ
ncbi:hypothetical protein MHYP_G00330630 [Metynnis hypsauchen]